ncbi:MAG: hypothetical protein KF878_12985 [Planctomycetes bacterium]|nr:hypothetical protein [Planctomycetota bacterium]
MVSRRLGLFAAAALLLVLVGAPRARTVPTVDPGPFWPLRVGHAGQAFSDALPRGAAYRLATGRLAPGLRLSATGEVDGTPTQPGVFEAVLEAREPSGVTYPVRVQATIRDAAERDLAGPARSFEAAGPWSTAQQDLRVDVRSTFDGRLVRTAVRLTLPVGLGRPAPLLLYHRGRGFDHDSYNAFHRLIASHGVAVASIEDRLSFAGHSFNAGDREYDVFRAELGMQSASGVVEAVADLLLARSSDAADPLGGAFDEGALFFAGHSRGGGAVHASHQRSFELRLRGVIYLMAFDLRYFPETAPPGLAPAYPIFDEQPRTPSLIIAAENDGDLTFPIADQLIDRAAGPTTQVTLWGGVHNLISDAHPAEGAARITRAQQTARAADWIVCFVRRWAHGEADLDARLYGPAHQGSAAYAVAAWSPSARTLLVEDAQDGDAARNLLGRNLVLDLRRTEQSVYPDMAGFSTLGLRHTLLTPTAAQSIWRMASDRPLDTRGHRRLVLRALQTGNQGWSGLGLWVRLVDAAGGQAWARVHEPGVAGSALPAWDGRSPHARFLDVHVDLAGLAVSGEAGFDRARVSAVDLVLVVRTASRVRSVAVDAVRFE